ncbi:MAG: LPS export ABC transporter periplasmic protein LptC [Candidatus Marinimicrobia bacterium]|nr:LPS export ABC transporter periplasmic protein LptC [Candidatus Neomarinimicrobiota bacterium]
MGKMFFSIVFIILISCTSNEENVTEISRYDLPDQQSWNSTIILTREGRKRAVIKSGHLVKYNDRKEIILDDNVDADFFSMEEKHLSNLKSRKALIYEATDNMLAIGNVVVVSNSGVTLYTDSLLWDNVAGQVITEDSVMLTTEGGDTLYGTGFKSNVDLTHWKIYHPWGVTGR